jgi:hypothetical protein
MNKTIKITLSTAATSTLLLSAFTSLAIAGNNGSVKTVSDCSHVNDNSFAIGEMVKGKGSNFDENADYRWTITKVDQPSQGNLADTGTFHLNAGETSFCIDLGQADIVANDSHSEFKWEVEENITDRHGNTSWKKVDSDNFSVDGVADDDYSQNATPTPTCTPTPTDEPTVTPTDGPTVTPTDVPVTPTDVPAATPTPTQDILSSGATTEKVEGIVLSANTMAATGTFETSLMNSLLAAGMMILGLSAISYAKEKRA